MTSKKRPGLTVVRGGKCQPPNPLPATPLTPTEKKGYTEYALAMRTCNWCLTAYHETTDATDCEHIHENHNPAHYTEIAK